MIAVSIVSHNHGKMVSGLVKKLLTCDEISQIFFTKNIPETVDIPNDHRLVLIENAIPKGFSANHNAAFTKCKQPFFCSLNPDVEFKDNPFSLLLKEIEAHRAALIAPLVVSQEGTVEDSIRYFPTLFSLFLKFLGNDTGHYVLKKGQESFCPEWVAGMFMLFRSKDYRQLDGFDEGFFLYYEDVDICARAWKAGMKVLACPSASVIHDAQRTSRRNLRYLRWHLASMARYFIKHWGRLPAVPKRA